MIWLPLLALALGFGLVFLSLRGVPVPADYVSYLSVAVLACLDSICGGLRAGLQKTFDVRVFTSGFFANAAIAALLAWTGELLGVDLYLAAVVALGIRIFYNLGIIRRHVLDVLLPRHDQAETLAERGAAEGQTVTPGPQGA